MLYYSQENIGDMMKIKRLLIALALILLVCSPGIVFADGCSYVEKAKLNEVSGKIKLNYEANVVKREEMVQSPDADEGVLMPVIREDITFVMKIYNITDDIYMIQSNNFDSETRDIYFKDTQDGVFAFESTDFENIIKYQFDIYSNNQNCYADKLKTITLTKPKIKDYYYFSMCEGLEDKVSACKQFITEESKLSANDVGQAVAKYQNDIKKTDTITDDANNKIIDFIQDNYIYMSIGVGVLVGTTIIAIFIVKKRRTL